MKCTAIIPARFLLMLSHLIILITVLQSRGNNVKAGLPLDHNADEFGIRDSQFLSGLVAGIVLTALELLGFFSGISMFARIPSMISIMCHLSGLVSLTHFIIDGWDSQLYWLIFSLCTIIPSIVEISVMISVVVLKRRV